MGDNFSLQLSRRRGALGDGSSLWFPFSAHEVLLWRDALVQLQIVCISGARKRGILQLSGVWSKWIKILQGTLLPVKLPRSCSFHSVNYTWSPGYVSSHLYWCHPPTPIIRGQLSSHSNQSHSTPCLWVDHQKQLEFSFCFVLFSSLYGSVHGKVVD